MKTIVTAFLFCLFTSVYTFGQVNAVVGGTVSDASGALIPGVEVTAKNVNTGIAATRITNETGAYDFPSLQPGVYTLSASLSGFQSATYNNVELGQGQQVRLNFSLQVGAAAQQVEVVAEADTLLATTSASVGNVLPDTTVRSLPVATRNVLDLVATTPAVVMTLNSFGAPVPNFGGTPVSQVNTTRDGLVTNDGRYNASNGAYSAIFTSPDMVEEVRISANSIDAALGRGSAQVQMRTRAGGNDFHGALFYTNNNSAFNAQGWFQNLVGAQKSYTNRNQFGGRLGGPIKKNKAFFFVLIDDQRYLEKVNLVSTVLTPEARQGIFRYLTAGSVGGTARRNGNAFSTTPSVDLNGRILTSDGTSPLFLNSFNLFTDVKDPNRTRIDPLWVGPQYLTRMPLPNDYTVGDGLNTAGFRWLQPHDGSDGATGQTPNTNRNHLTTRFDYQVNTNNKLTFTMSREKNTGVTAQTGLPDFPAGAFGDVKRNPDFYTASWTSTISATVLNEARFGLKRDPWTGTSPFDKGCCWDGAKETDLVDSAKQMVASFPSIDGKMLYVSTPAATAGGVGLGTYAPFGTSSPRQSISPFKQYADTLSFTHGAHSFQAGAEFDFASTKQSNHGSSAVGTTRPIATLGPGNIAVPNITATNFKGLQANDITTAQNLLANLAGSISSIVQEYFVNSPSDKDWTDYRTTILFSRDLHENDWDFFFKDNWKVTKNFTLNLGLRYDKYGTPYDTTGLAGRPKGGQAGLFGCSGTDFSVMWNPNVGCDVSKLTTVEYVGKDSPNPDKLIYGNDWNNWAPSVGFSYAVPWLKRSTVLRGGYGINYSGPADFLAYSANIGNLPGTAYGATYSPSTTYLDVAGVAAAKVLPVTTSGALPFSSVPLTNRTQGIITYADKRVIPYIQSFNLSLQHELARNVTLDVSWVGNKASKLFGPTQLNDTNIFENGILDAFNVTRNGGNAPLFDRILNGLNVTGVGVVNGTTLTGSQALRRLSTTNAFIANGEVGALANFLNTSSSFTNVPGGLLANGNLPQNFIVVNPQFGSVQLEGNNTNSSYHSLQTLLTKRFSSGLSGQASYAWSKALGDTGVRDPRNRVLSKGLLDIDRTQIFKVNGTWELPFGQDRALLSSAPRIVSRLVEGWQISPVLSYVTGAPLTFSSARTTLSQRAMNTADLVGKMPGDLGKVAVGNGFVQYFSNLTSTTAPIPTFGGDTNLPSRFSNQVVLDQSGNVVLQNPVAGTTGNTARLLPGVKGPGTFNFDMAVQKKVRISESKTFTIRADAIGALNRPIWGNPVTDINSSTFGRITTASGSRTVTINARMDF